MHQHGVAHMDLKPVNILMPLRGGHLSIDFNTSVRAKGMKDMFRGVVGTPGYLLLKSKMIVACTMRFVRTCGPVERHHISCANSVGYPRIAVRCLRSPDK